MHSQDQAVLKQALIWCQGHEPAWLCTIVETVGASPRPKGSMLVCNAQGHSAGSLSGGCVEEDLVVRLGSGEIDTGTPLLLDYGVTAEENERLGLPCGGRLRILVQALTASDSEWLEQAAAAVNERRCLLRTVSLNSGETRVEAAERYTELSVTHDTLSQCFGPQMRMLLVGAGQLAQSLAELAQAMDYHIMVTDPRPEVLAQWPGPEVELIQGMPDDVVLAHAADRFAIVITLTHDPRIDDMALMEALATDAWYVGALGSQRTTDKRLQRLRDLDVTEAHIKRLHAPVGLPIGSKTPVEIAVAIMAEITSLRRRR